MLDFIREKQTEMFVTFSDGDSRITLNQILVFSTGTDCIPAIGFEPLPTVGFQHDKRMGYQRDFVSKFPIASTCSNTLYLPVLANYNEFKHFMEEGILQSPGFGLP